ncbi:basic phospholipase A2 RVV-VD-like [Trichosurus vulpecula]|uniref:basic phospholipase A2 RVV-VD-like n=1 Tax=Trichosurus vulpecula TaxID=9337 RepID=UPI00186B002A|nr:basic phospholipase A2 RVV-VD-like [Trichosurus vulpecula]
MKTTFLLAVLMACGLSEVKGNWIQFREMIGKLTGKNALFSYGFYGCYCGWGGRGTPLDATDRCCLAHDCCYSKVTNLGCKPKIQSYKYTYQYGSIFCGSGNNCQKQTCACDQAVAYCLKKYLYRYNVNYRNYPMSLCTGKNAKC